MSACSLGCSATAMALLEAGAIVDVKNVKGETARERACEQGDAEVMATILRRSKDFNPASDAGGVLLYKACLSGFTGPAFVLISKMAPVRCVVDGRSYSALEGAKAKPRNLLGEPVKVSEDRSSLVAKLRELSPESSKCTGFP
jgi:ankyrin repeat protein